VVLPGLILAGRAAGTLTLSNAMGSVTLALTSPPAATPVPASAAAATPGVGTFPTTLDYVIVSGTGAYAGDTDSGTITVLLGVTATAAAANPVNENTFTFVIS
jgi:hypothetical protein